MCQTDMDTGYMNATLGYLEVIQHDLYGNHHVGMNECMFGMRPRLSIIAYRLNKFDRKQKISIGLNLIRCDIYLITGQASGRIVERRTRISLSI